MYDTRKKLVLDYPFFGTLALSMEIKETYSIPTLSTNGKDLRFNPDFTNSLSQKERIFCFLHEIGHIIFMHHFRRGDRDPDIWNMAGDYAINIMLSDSVDIDFPENCLIDAKYTGWSTEKIYDELYDKYKDQVSEQTITVTMSGEGEGDNDDQGEGDNDDQGEDDKDQSTTDQVNTDQKSDFQEKLEAVKQSGIVEDAPKDLPQYDFESSVSAAISVNNMSSASKIPEESSLARQLEEMTSSRVPWRAVLQRFMNQACQDDYNWCRPNHRFSQATNGIIMPSLYSENKIELAIVFDTSYSIDMRQCSLFFAEFKSLIKTISYKKLHVMSCSDYVSNFQEFYPGQEIEYKPSGIGGTASAPVWKYLKDKQIRPTCLVYFTDLEVFDWGKDPGFPILWLADSRTEKNFKRWENQVPFGEAVFMRKE